MNLLAISETDILERVVSPKRANLSPDTARSLLAFTFDREAKATIRALLRKNNRGSISAEERLALEKYLRVGQFLDLIHAKARLCLQKPNNSQ